MADQRRPNDPRRPSDPRRPAGQRPAGSKPATKEERRRQAREERRLKELAEAKRRRRNRIVGTLSGIGAVGGIVAVIVLTRTPPAVVGITVDPTTIQAARTEAGCVAETPEALTASPHLTPEQAPPVDVLYTGGRPTASGLHFAQVNPAGGFDSPVDERATTHNLEHGAAVLWYDPNVATEADIAEATAWAEARSAAGFRPSAVSGQGIIVSPYEQALDSGKAFAFRAWVATLDCDEFVEDVADAFLLDHYGGHGASPEGAGTQFPDDVLAYRTPGSSESETPSETSSPTGSETATSAPSETASATEEPSATESPSEPPTETPTASET